MSEKKPEAKKPKLKLKPFGTGKFSTGEGWVHLADALARGAKAVPVVMKFGERRWRLEK